MRASTAQGMCNTVRAWRTMTACRSLRVLRTRCFILRSFGKAVRSCTHMVLVVTRISHLSTAKARRPSSFSSSMYCPFGAGAAPAAPSPSLCASLPGVGAAAAEVKGEAQAAAEVEAVEVEGVATGVSSARRAAALPDAPAAAAPDPAAVAAARAAARA